MAADSQKTGKLVVGMGPQLSLETHPVAQVYEWAREKYKQLVVLLSAQGNSEAYSHSGVLQVTCQRVLSDIHQITSLSGNGNRAQKKVALLQYLGRQAQFSRDGRRLFNFTEAVFNGVDPSTAGQICNMEPFSSITSDDFRSYHINEGLEVKFVLFKSVKQEHKKIQGDDAATQVLRMEKFRPVKAPRKDGARNLNSWIPAKK